MKVEVNRKAACIPVGEPPMSPNGARLDSQTSRHLRIWLSRCLNGLSGGLIRAPPERSADNTSEKRRSPVIEIWAFVDLGYEIINQANSGVGQWESVPGHCVNASVLLATQCVIGMYFTLPLEFVLKLI